MLIFFPQDEHTDSFDEPYEATREDAGDAIDVDGEDTTVWMFLFMFLFTLLLIALFFVLRSVLISFAVGELCFSEASTGTTCIFREFEYEEGERVK